MKKLIVSFSALLLSVGMFAQESTEVLTSKKGTPILPQQGDYAIGIEATPYFNYIGNMFNGTSDNSLDLGSQTLYGRYFIANDAAIRVLFSINSGVSNYKTYVTDDAAVYQNPLSQDKVVDIQENKYNNLTLGVGYQKFRGYGRLRGFYGAQLTFSKASLGNYSYTYGNPMTELNQEPSSAYGNGSSRPVEATNGNQFNINLGGLAGVEYYFAPKICIGGEIGLGFNYAWSTQASSVSESYNTALGQVEKVTSIQSPGSNAFNISSYRPTTYGGLYLMFHF